MVAYANEAQGTELEAGVRALDRSLNGTWLSGGPIGSATILALSDSHARDDVGGGAPGASTRERGPAAASVGAILGQRAP